MPAAAEWRIGCPTLWPGRPPSNARCIAPNPLNPQRLSAPIPSRNPPMRKARRSPISRFPRPARRRFACPITRATRRPLFLPEGQHARLHDRRRRFPRPAQGVREARRGGRRHLARLDEVARRLQGEDGVPVPAALGCRRKALHAVRCHQDEKHVRQESPRHRAQSRSRRGRRKARPKEWRKSEGRRPRRGSPGRREGADSLARAAPFSPQPLLAAQP